MAGHAICRQCHKFCKRCSSYSTTIQECFDCIGFIHGNQCVNECPINYYANQLDRQCYACSAQCNGECYGPEANQCKENTVAHENQRWDFNQKLNKMNCSEECDVDGCFGPGPDQCYGCAHVQFNGICLSSCKRWPNLYLMDDMKNCKECHSKCSTSCHGPEEIHCLP